MDRVWTLTARARLFETTATTGQTRPVVGLSPYVLGRWVRWANDCTFARNAAHPAFTMPYAIERRDPITDHHDGQRRTRRHVIAAVGYEPGAVLVVQPIDGSHLAAMYRCPGANRKIIIYR